MGMDKLRETLSKYPIKTRFMLSGKIVVARDIAHAKLNERLQQDGALPDYFKPDDDKYSFYETESLEDVIPNCDVLYMTRIQRERFPDILEYEKVKDSYVIDAKLLENAPQHMKVLHPLPRVNEIANDIDSTPHAGYFPQAKNGLIMRQAILLKLLGVQL
jgi:aspartate carbamoyltransferase catalytic subunit